MPALVSGSWWPLSTESAFAKPHPSEEVNSKCGKEPQSATLEQTKSVSFWSWSMGLSIILREATSETPPSREAGHHMEQQNPWWSSVTRPQSNVAGESVERGSGSSKSRPDLLKTHVPLIEAIPTRTANNTNNSETINLQNGWLSWLSFSNADSADCESDTEDKRDLEVFREAKAAVESNKDSCHYAVSKLHALNSVSLAVYGTSTENSPVSFNEKKQPIMPHQLLENAIPRVAKSVETQSGDQSKRQTRNNLSSLQPIKTSGITSDAKVSSQYIAKSAESSKSIQTNNSKADRNEVITKDLLLQRLPAPADRDYPGDPSSLTPVSPGLDSNFRVITLSTKLRLWGEAIVCKEATSGTHIYKSTSQSVAQKRKKLVKRVLVISVHSFLPTKFVRSVISQSTGSASTLAENAVSAVNRWAREDGTKEIQVQSIALDGIGTIESRVRTSLRLLRNWGEDMRNSDFVFMVANSAASPAAIQILQQLINKPDYALKHKKVGFLSMSGALQGPLPGLDAKVIRRAYTCNEYDIIMELFEFQKSNSESSKKLTESVDDLCQSNVKLAFMGSIDDQFIPISSSVLYQTSHPHIFKGLFVDKKLEVPVFLIRLLSIILIMENVGNANHYQLFKDLLEISRGPSAICATHGEIIKCPDVYDTGIKLALETTSLKIRKNAEFKMGTMHTGDAERNLYHLPWHVRGLINDLLQTKHIKNTNLLKDLVCDYRAWEPTTRPWREIKLCFAAFEESSPEDLML